MQKTTVVSVALISCGPLLRGAAADIVYQTQDRSISAATSFDGNAQSVIAPNFGPFVESLSLSTPFPTPGGGTALNQAGVGIDCQLDPNAILVVGSLSGSGGLGVVGGTNVLQLGEAQARVNVAFTLAAATPFTMLATARPNNHPGDRFKIKLEDLTNHTVLFFLDDTMPPQAVNLSGILGPGDLSLEYQVEMTVDGPETLRDFSFNLTVPAPGAMGLLVAAGVIGLRRRR